MEETQGMILYEGKVKSVIECIKDDQVLIHYHDKVTAGNGEKEDYPEGKGEIRLLDCKVVKFSYEEKFIF